MKNSYLHCDVKFFDVELHITVVSILKTNCKIEVGGKLGNEQKK